METCTPISSTNDQPQKETLLTKEKNRRPLSRCFRFTLFLVMTTVECSISISTGILSSASKVIKKDLDLDNKTFGLFGTANGVGRVIGCFIYGVVNQYINPKYILLFELTLKGASCIAFKLIDNAIILITLRGVIGFCHMPFYVYFNCWINQYGIQKYKNEQISTVHFVSQLGKSMGYFIIWIIGQENWHNGFVFEGLYLFFAVLIFAITSNDYFSAHLYVAKEGHGLEAVVIKDHDVTVFEEDTSTEKSTEKNHSHTYFDDLGILFKNPIFVSGFISRTILFGLNGGLHFWFSDYMRTVLHIEQNSLITLTYTIICCTGPLGGVIGNNIFKPLIGSYESRKASWSVVVVHIIATIFGIGISLMPGPWTLTAAAVGYFIFNSIALPVLQGILLTSVDKELTATGYSIVNLMTQLVVAGNAPVFYGVVNDIFKDTYPHMAMLCLMSIHVLGIPTLCYMAYKRNQKFDLEAKLEEEGKELEEKN